MPRSIIQYHFLPLYNKDSYIQSKIKQLLKRSDAFCLMFWDSFGLIRKIIERELLIDKSTTGFIPARLIFEKFWNFSEKVE